MRILWMSATTNSGWLAEPVAKTSEPMSMLRAVTTPSNGAAMLAKRFQRAQAIEVGLRGGDLGVLGAQIADLLVDRLLRDRRGGSAASSSGPR